MQIEIRLNQNDLRKLVLDEIQRRLGDVEFEESQVNIECKSKQNYRAEWETAEFRAILNVTKT